jgi:hypothetical protein
MLIYLTICVAVHKTKTDTDLMLPLLPSPKRMFFERKIRFINTLVYSLIFQRNLLRSRASQQRMKEVKEAKHSMKETVIVLSCTPTHNPHGASVVVAC